MSSERKRSLRDARDAVDIITTLLLAQDDEDSLSDADVLLVNFDQLASALCDIYELDLGDSELDEVLLEIDAPEDLVEDIAELIEIAGRTSYGGPVHGDVNEVLKRAGDMADRLNELVGELEDESDR